MTAFIMAGQSNMVGQGLVNQLSKEMIDHCDNVMIYEPYNVPFRLDQIHTHQRTFGPEVGFGIEASRKHKTVVIIKMARDGASLFSWKPKWTKWQAEITGNVIYGPLYNKLISYAKLVMRATESKLGGIMWMQGERDARFQKAGTAYKENFKFLIDSFRKDFQIVPFVFGRINPPPGYKWRGDVRKAQLRIPKEIKMTKMVNTDDCEMKKDNLHYSNSGLLQIGTRFAKAITDDTHI